MDIFLLPQNYADSVIFLSFILLNHLFILKKNCFVDIVKRIDRVSLLLHHNLSMYCLKFLGFLFYMNIFYFRYVGFCLFNVIENLNIFVVGIFYYHLIMGVEVNKIQSRVLEIPRKRIFTELFHNLRVYS